MAKGKQLLSLLLLLASVVSVSFAFVPSALAQVIEKDTSTSPCKAHKTYFKISVTSLSTSTSPTTKLCSQVENTMSSSIPKWFQHEISITAPSRGCHLITSDITKAIQKDMSSIKIGMANLFIQHTSASLTVNENADPDVRRLVYYQFIWTVLSILREESFSDV